MPLRVWEWPNKNFVPFAISVYPLCAWYFESTFNDVVLLRQSRHCTEENASTFLHRPVEANALIHYAFLTNVLSMTSPK